MMQATTDLQRLADDGIEALDPYRRRAAGLNQRRILMLLAEGRPVTLDRVAASAGMTTRPVGRLLRVDADHARMGGGERDLLATRTRA